MVIHENRHAGTERVPVLRPAPDLPVLTSAERVVRDLRRLLTREGAHLPKQPGGGCRILVEAQLVRDVIALLDPPVCARPAYNHTREDSRLTPCPACAAHPGHRNVLATSEGYASPV